MIERMMELHEHAGRVWFCETVEDAAAAGYDLAFVAMELLSMQLAVFGEAPPTLYYLFGPALQEFSEMLAMGVAPFCLSACACENSVLHRRRVAHKHSSTLGHGSVTCRSGWKFFSTAFSEGESRPIVFLSLRHGEKWC